MKLSLICVLLVGCASTVPQPDSARRSEFTFNSLTGTGVVGKGVIQNAFGWKDGKEAKEVSFTYQSREEYEAVCSSGGIYYPVHTVTKGLMVTDLYDARSLLGYTRTAESGDVPVVGGRCPGGTWQSAKVVNSDPGSLLATYNNTIIILQ